MRPVFPLYSELKRELAQEVAAPEEVRTAARRNRLRPLKQVDKSKVSSPAKKKKKIPVNAKNVKYHVCIKLLLVFFILSSSDKPFMMQQNIIHGVSKLCHICHIYSV